MKHIVSIVVLCMMAQSSMAATPATGRGRASMSAQMMAAPRAAGIASKNQISASAMQKAAIKDIDNAPANNLTADLAVTPEPMMPADKKNMREKEKNACLSNNIGIGNTFVWASRYSNLNNYSTMVEDIENPENNTCFVRVEIKSNDPKISVSDVPSKYFEMGKNITCGDWANYDTLKQRILDAKKSARTWATIGGVVGGAGIGVGAMELFGNKLIGGDVEGQKALSDDELLRSQLAVLKQENPTEYDKFKRHLRILARECKNTAWDSASDVQLDEKNDLCDKYDGIFDLATNN